MSTESLTSWKINKLHFLWETRKLSAAAKSSSAHVEKQRIKLLEKMLFSPYFYCQARRKMK